MEIPVHIDGEVAPTAVHNVEENVLVIEADALKVPESVVVDIEGLEPGEHVYAAAREALETYADDVRSGAFPEEQHTYSIPDEELARFEEGVRAG